MLTELRQHSKSFLIYLLFGIIILVFVFTFNTGIGGGDDVGCTGPTIPVFSRVDGKEITQDNLIMAVRALPMVLAKSGGTNLILASGVDAGALRAANIEDLTAAHAEAYLQLLELVHVAAGTAREMGLSVSDEDLKEAVYGDFYKKDPKAEEEGIPSNKLLFDRETFQTFVTYRLRSSEGEYQNFVRQALLASRLYQTLENSLASNPMELELLTRAYETRAAVSFVEFSAEMFADKVTLSDEDVAAFAKDHADEILAYRDSRPGEFKAVTEVATAAELPEDVRRDIATRLLKEKMARSRAEELAKKTLAALQAREDKDLEAALKELDVPEADREILEEVFVQESGEFSLQSSTIPKLAGFKDLFEEIFRLTLDKPVGTKVYAHEEGNRFAVVLLKELTIPDTLTEAQKAMSRPDLQQLWESRYLPALAADLRAKAVQEGRVERTLEFQEFLNALLLQEQQRMQRALKQAGLNQP